MTLGELLEELRENILHDRSDRTADSADDYLWSDKTLVRYINEAHKRFARKALVLRDGTTSSVTRITLETATKEYPLHRSVIGVLSARLIGDNADLARAGHSALDTYRVPDTYFFDPSQLATLPPGKPLAWSTDEYLSADSDGTLSVATLRIYPEPSADYNARVIYLRTIRLPLADLTLDNLDAVPEIPEEHHVEMLDWAAYLALRIVDTDAGFPARAAEFRQSFEQHVEEAKDLAMRKIFTPLQWGFGRNAFSWEGN